MTTPRRLARLATSLAILACIAALPWALIHLVGWPLPTVAPDPAQIGLAIRSADIPDVVLIKGLACVVWLAWGDLVLAFAWELVINHPRLARGQTVRPPVVVNRWMAALATYVIAGLLTAATVAGPANAAPLRANPAPHELVPDTARDLAPPALAPPRLLFATQTAAPQTGAGNQTWTTQRGDTLWNIAQITTGDPNRFADILALNADQLTRPRDLRPGMVLRLPAGAHTPDNRGPELAESGPPRTHVVQPGESEWSVAQDEVPGQPAAAVAPLWADIVAANAPTVPDPNLLYPGQTLLIPGEAAPATTPTPPAAPPTQAPGPPTPAVPDMAAAALPAPTPPAGPAQAAPNFAPPEQAPAATPVPAPANPSARHERAGRNSTDLGWVLGAGGILTAAGVSAEILRRRRRAMARRRPGERPAAIPPHLDEVARSVLSSPIDDALWLAAELRLVCAAVPEASRDVFGVTVVQYDPQHTIEIALTSPIADPPDGWEAQAGGLVWALTKPHDEAELAAALDLPPAVPAVVTVGDPDDTTQTLLNIEQAGLIGLVGDPAMVTAAVRSFVWELATTPLSEHVQLIGLGVDVPGATTLDHWTTVADVDELLVELAVAARETCALLPAGLSPVAVRCKGREAVAPTVAVVSADRATTEVLDAVGPGVVVVVVGAVPDVALEVRVADGQLVVPALGLMCPARQLNEELSDAMGQVLVLSATPTSPAEPVESPSKTSPTPVSVRQATDDPDEQAAPADPWGWLPPEPRVWLTVLGSVAARGAELTQQQIAALAYLDLHRHPAPTTAQMKDALWGGIPPTSQRWRDFLYTLRRAAGPGAVVSDGEDGLALGPDVGTDITLVETLLDRAESHPAQRWMCLERAIGQIEGVPFTIPTPAARYWRWIDAEYLDARIYARLAEAAELLGRHHLANEEPAKAKLVAEAGLRALPIDSALTELLMDAYDALGSPVAAERVFDAHQRALDDLGLSCASDETQAVIDRIRAARQKPRRQAEYAGGGV